MITRTAAKNARRRDLADRLGSSDMWLQVLAYTPLQDLPQLATVNKTCHKATKILQGKWVGGSPDLIVPGHGEYGPCVLIRGDRLPRLKVSKWGTRPPLSKKRTNTWCVDPKNTVILSRLATSASEEANWLESGAMWAHHVMRRLSTFSLHSFPDNMSVSWTSAFGKMIEALRPSPVSLRIKFPKKSSFTGVSTQQVMQLPTSLACLRFPCELILKCGVQVKVSIATLSHLKRVDVFAPEIQLDWAEVIDAFASSATLQSVTFHSIEMTDPTADLIASGFVIFAGSAYFINVNIVCFKSPRWVDFTRL